MIFLLISSNPSDLAPGPSSNVPSSPSNKPFRSTVISRLAAHCWSYTGSEHGPSTKQLKNEKIESENAIDLVVFKLGNAQLRSWKGRHDFCQQAGRHKPHQICVLCNLHLTSWAVMKTHWCHTSTLRMDSWVRWTGGLVQQPAGEKWPHPYRCTVNCCCWLMWITHVDSHHSIHLHLDCSIFLLRCTPVIRRFWALPG